MANYTAKFDNYRIFYYTGPDINPLINCYDDTKSVGQIRFYEKSAAMPPNTVIESGQGRILKLHYRLEQFQDVIEVMRYEKPLHLWLETINSQGGVCTSEYEPVGEEESS